MGTDTLNGKYIALIQRIEALEEAIKVVALLEERVSANSAALLELTRILKGDPDLKVPPLRADVLALRESIENIQQTYDRAKWIAIGLGATNAGAVITWLVTLLGGP